MKDVPLTVRQLPNGKFRVVWAEFNCKIICRSASKIEAILETLACIIDLKDQGDVPASYPVPNPFEVKEN